MTLTPRRAPSPPAEPKRKALSLGAQPPAPSGENCDVRDILAAAVADQGSDFGAVRDVLKKAPDPKVHEAVETLNALHRSFGDNEK